MKIDESKDAVPDTVSEGDHQNRREFFNGLGKWSMIVVAAVSFLRGSVIQVHAGSEGTQRPDWEPRETASQRLAKKPQHHNWVGYEDKPHADVPHVDARIQPGAGPPSGQPPAKVQE
jgi:hypothetical protein